MILDVGCGAAPRGHVNLDLYPFEKKQDSRNWNPKTTPNFVRGDAQNLPFRDKSFEGTVSFHCLEHLPNPLQALREFRRVTRKTVFLRMPSEVTVNLHTETHLFKWDPTTLRNLLSLVFNTVQTGYTDRHWITEHRFAKYIHAFGHVLLGKIGLHGEIYAICS